MVWNFLISSRNAIPWMNHYECRLDILNPSSCDCPSKIPLDSNANCFMPFSSGSSSPEDAEFCLTCAWSNLLLGPETPLAHYPEFIACLATTFQKVVPQVKRLSVKAFKDLYVSCRVLKNSIVIPQSAHQALDLCFHEGFEVYSSTLQLLP
jgi:hypothetical protein